MAKRLGAGSKLHPEHISAYHLIYEENTALWKLREQHKVAEADEDLSVSLFGTLIDSLSAAGYDHYEISNFCLPDCIPAIIPVTGPERNTWVADRRHIPTTASRVNGILLR